MTHKDHSASFSVEMKKEFYLSILSIVTLNYLYFSLNTIGHFFISTQKFVFYQPKNFKQSKNSKNFNTLSMLFNSLSLFSTCTPR